MKCTICHAVLGTETLIVTYVGPHLGQQTINIHFHCLSELVGRGRASELRSLIARSGWVQEALPS